MRSRERELLGAKEQWLAGVAGLWLRRRQVRAARVGRGGPERHVVQCRAAERIWSARVPRGKKEL